MSTATAVPRGRIITQNSARRSITAGGPRPTHHAPAAQKHDTVGGAKSAGARLKTVRTTDARLHSDVYTKRQIKLSESSEPPHSDSQEARKKLQRVIGMVRSFVRFTGAKKLLQDEDEDYFNFTASVEATYMLEPIVRAVTSRITNSVKQAVSPMITNYVYDAENAPKYSRALASAVIDAMKELQLGRYRFVVNVTIGGDCGQDVGLSSRCLWDDQRDNFATIPFKGNDYFIVITVHAVYLD